MSLITLTTDFGYVDTYNAVMKGVILSINPDCRIIDVTLNIQPHNIKSACFALMTTFSYFPKKTIHVAVVDPGVGTDRRPIVIDAGDHIFVGPDNGIFSFIFADRKQTDLKVYEIANKKYRLACVSNTFHGRDVFAPAAAHLSLGVPVSSFGKMVSDVVSYRLPEPVLKKKDIIEGEIIHIDRFGNIISNISKVFLVKTLKKPFSAELKGKSVTTIVTAYGFAPDRELFCIYGSSGFLEISLKNESAAEKLGCIPGDKIIIKTNQYIH